MPAIGPFRPDWMVLGVIAQQHNQVWVIASNELYDGEIEEDTEMEEIVGSVLRRFVTGRTTTQFTTKMRTYQIAMGADFSEAMSNLLRAWSPSGATPDPSV